MSHSASILQVATLAGLEQALNAALALDANTNKRLQSINGKIIELDFSNTDQRLFLQPLNGNLKLMSHYAGAVDTTLRGSLFDLLRLRSERSGEVMFGRGVEIDGDVELGTQFQRIIEKLDIDWEEHLSRISGDIIAHQIGNTVRELFTWGKRAASHLSDDITDYLQEETYTLPTGTEIENFLDEIDTLRSDVDRLEAKLKKLRKTLVTKD